jgi:hypothetical protein
VHQLRRALIILIAVALSSCTANLTSSPQFRELVGRELMLIDTGQDRNWHFWRAPAINISHQSEDYRLNLHDRASMPKNSMFRDPKRVEDLGSAVGATIVIRQVREYGMETAYPVALGTITLPNGHSYPFEAVWRPEYSQHVRPVG